jgi:hypothetical protein
LSDAIREGRDEGLACTNEPPDRATGIGAWSDADIKQTLRTGIRPNGVPLAGVMPSGFYVNITDGDMNAIVAYLRSLQAISNKVPDLVYRTAALRETFPGAEQPLENGGGDSKVMRGFYLATIGHCMACHTPVERGRHDFTGRLGVGGVEFSGPWGKSVAPNITEQLANNRGRRETGCFTCLTETADLKHFCLSFNP